MNVPQSIFDLTPAEKLQLLEDLWDDLAATPESVPIHQWQKDESAARKARLEANPASGVSWDSAKHRIRHRHGERPDPCAGSAPRTVESEAEQRHNYDE